MSSALPEAQTPQGLTWNDKRNLIVLAGGQALFISAASMLIAIGGLVGQALATDKSLATLPVSSYVIGMALGTVPASLIMRRIGRRAGFQLGTLIGFGGALVCSLAVYLANFWLLAAGTLFVGMFGATAQLYRFAAADGVPEWFRGKAISLVLAGGVVAGFIGPQIAKLTRTLFSGTEFLGAYLSASALLIVSMLLLSFLRIPPPAPQTVPGSGRPLGEIIAQPRFLVAVLSSMIGYGTMTLLMTATPLAMVAHPYPFDDAATVIQWHVVGMFLPGFFTGSLIARFGVLRVIFTGVAIDLLCVAIALSGDSFYHYWSALVLLGIGWNFMFVGGSTLLTTTHSTAERAKTQATAEFCTFGTQAVASLSSGSLLFYLGWDRVLWTGLPMLVIVGVSVVLLTLHERRRHAAA